MSRGAEWRRVGRDLAERFTAHSAEYAAAGYTSGEAYRVAFVRQCWPNVGQHVKRQIREGWREVQASDA